MQFRSPHGDDIRIALTSGHVAIVGGEWRELPELFHYDAVLNGCERSDQPPMPGKVDVVADPNAMNRIADHDSAYREALATMVMRDVASDFTKDHLPNVNAVSRLCGFSAKKEDVLRVFRAMKEETASGPDA